MCAAESREEVGVTEGRCRVDTVDTVRLDAVVERKSASLPRFVVVLTEVLAPWRLRGTTVVDVTLDGTVVGRRSLKRWGNERDCWFFDLTETQCRQASVETGEGVSVELRLASTDLPTELVSLLESATTAKRVWNSLTPARRRMLAEHVRRAKRPETRTRRATVALATDERAQAPCS